MPPPVLQKNKFVKTDYFTYGETEGNKLFRASVQVWNVDYCGKRYIIQVGGDYTNPTRGPVQNLFCKKHLMTFNGGGMWKKRGHGYGPEDKLNNLHKKRDRSETDGVSDNYMYNIHLMKKSHKLDTDEYTGGHMLGTGQNTPLTVVFCDMLDPEVLKERFAKALHEAGIKHGKGGPWKANTERAGVVILFPEFCVFSHLLNGETEESNGIVVRVCCESVSSNELKFHVFHLEHAW